MCYTPRDEGGVGPETGMENRGEEEINTDAAIVPVSIFLPPSVVPPRRPNFIGNPHSAYHLGCRPQSPQVVPNRRLKKSNAAFVKIQKPTMRLCVGNFFPRSRPQIYPVKGSQGQSRGLNPRNFFSERIVANPNAPPVPTVAIKPPSGRIFAHVRTGLKTGHKCAATTGTPKKDKKLAT